MQMTVALPQSSVRPLNICSVDLFARRLCLLGSNALWITIADLVFHLDHAAAFAHLTDYSIIKVRIN